MEETPRTPALAQVDATAIEDDTQARNHPYLDCDCGGPLQCSLVVGIIFFMIFAVIYIKFVSDEVKFLESFILDQPSLESADLLGIQGNEL